MRGHRQHAEARDSSMACIDTEPGDQSFLISDLAESTIPAYMREVYNSACHKPAKWHPLRGILRQLVG